MADFHDLFKKKDCLNDFLKFLYFWELENKMNKMAKYAFWDFF